MRQNIWCTVHRYLWAFVFVADTSKGLRVFSDTEAKQLLDTHAEEIPDTLRNCKMFTNELSISKTFKNRI